MNDALVWRGNIFTIKIAALIQCRNRYLMQRRSLGGKSCYRIILTSMHKENREKNKENEYKRSDPISFQVLFIKWIDDYYSSNTPL